MVGWKPAGGGLTSMYGKIIPSMVFPYIHSEWRTWKRHGGICTSLLYMAVFAGLAWRRREKCKLVTNLYTLRLKWNVKKTVRLLFEKNAFS